MKKIRHHLLCSALLYVCSGGRGGCRTREEKARRDESFDETLLYSVLTASSAICISYYVMSCPTLSYPLLSTLLPSASSHGWECVDGMTDIVHNGTGHSTAALWSIRERESILCAVLYCAVHCCMHYCTALHCTVRLNSFNSALGRAEDTMNQDPGPCSDQDSSTQLLLMARRRRKTRQGET